MYEIKIFEGHNVEIIELNGQVLFNPYNVGECLELTDSAVRMAIAKMNNKQVRKLTNSIVSEVDFRKIHNTGENFLTESGVYKLVFKSHKENAERFQDWVTDEVLPSIRKHGAYMTEETLEKALTSPDFLIQLATKLKEEKEKNFKLEAKIEKDKPKVEYHDNVINTGNLITTTNIAKDLGYRSAQPLNKILVKNKIIFPKKNKDGKIKGYEVTADYNWLITEKYADYQIFDEKNSNPCLKFTEKGRQWIIDNINNHKWNLS